MFNVVFFINRYNDIDQMTPIMYKMSLEKKYNIHVLSINPNIEIYTDFRLRFLVENNRIMLDYFYKYNKKSWLSCALGNLICINKKYNTSRTLLNAVLWFMSNSVRFFLFKIIKLDITILIKKIYDKKWVKELFLDKRPAILVFDAVSRPSLYNIDAVLSVAKEMHIPTIDVPHGVPLYITHPEQFNRAKVNLVKYKKDHFIMNHKWWKAELLSFGLNPKNTPILGNARFCNEWVKILDKITPSDNILDRLGEGKLKVAYMEMGSVHDVDVGMVRDAMMNISSLDFLTLAVKPQTRSNRVNLNHEFSDRVYMATNENSVNLIKWADVVIVIVSSIVIEALIRDKHVIYLKFTHKGRMLFDKYKACWAVESYAELESSLRELYKNRECAMYNNYDKNRFLNEVVFNGFSEESILDSYNDYIFNIVNKN